MHGSHDARAVANWLIGKALDAKETLTPLQVIKLVYFAHGWTLGFYARPLFYQDVEAWRHGPVVADVYHSLKQYGGNAITDKIPGIDERQFYDEENDIISQVFDVYGSLSGLQLSALTHQKGTPWARTIKSYRQGAVIPNTLIQEYFEGIRDE